MKRIAVVTAALVLLSVFAGCGAEPQEIYVISREAGSGTRDAFVRLFGVERTDARGTWTDAVTPTAEITSSGGVMLTGVADCPAAIGYVSMGALNDSVKALEIDGAAASAENVRNGSYPVSRPFLMVMGSSLSPQARDFAAYILSDTGQQVVEAQGYVSGGTAGAYRMADAAGEITVSGSSSVFPVMEKLAEAYMAVRPGVEIVLQISDSTTGIRDAAGGLCDIGMASRELKDSERAEGLLAHVIAVDGIAVIVHPENPLRGLTREQVRRIYIGELTHWGRLTE